jgi:transcriptional regulator with XRE-family HTH domain
MTTMTTRTVPAAPARVIRRPGASIVIAPWRLTWYRESRGWSRQDLAAAVTSLGWPEEEGGRVTLTRNALDKLEKGRDNGGRNPKPATLQAICEALSVLDKAPQYDENDRYAGFEWRRLPEDRIVRIEPRDLFPSGPPLPERESPSQLRAAMVEHNAALRAFAEEHVIPYRNPETRRIYYHQSLQDAFALQASGASHDRIEQAVTYARAAALPGQDPALLAS